MRNTYSRVCLVQCISSSFYGLISLEFIFIHLAEEDLKFDQGFLIELLSVFSSHSEKILWQICQTYSKPLDPLPLAIICAGVSEVIKKKEIPLLIKEYIKVADCFSINPSLINGVLHDVYHRYYKVETELRDETVFLGRGH